MRILIADDHALFRDGLRSLLEARGQEVVGEANTGRTAVALARDLQPDIVLMDLDMPDMGGLEATRLISADMPDINVVVVTASEEEADLFEAIKSGAHGYLHKNLEADRLIALLNGVMAGEPALTPGLARKVLGAFAAPPAHAPKPETPDESLTPRESEVLDLLAQGVTSTHDLADRLFISENTVKYHLKQILQKLHLQNRAQVVAYAIKHGHGGPTSD